MGKPLSKVKKELKPHMWVISKDSAGGYIVTMGLPKKPGSRIKARFSGDGAKEELKYWVKYDMPKQVSPDHMIDMTGLKLVPEFYTKWYVDNMMAEVEDDQAEASKRPDEYKAGDKIHYNGKPAKILKIKPGYWGKSAIVKIDDEHGEIETNMGLDPRFDAKTPQEVKKREAILRKALGAPASSTVHTTSTLLDEIAETLQARGETELEQEVSLVNEGLALVDEATARPRYIDQFIDSWGSLDRQWRNLEFALSSQVSEMGGWGMMDLKKKVAAALQALKAAKKKMPADNDIIKAQEEAYESGRWERA